MDTNFIDLETNMRSKSSRQYSSLPQKMFSPVAGLDINNGELFISKNVSLNKKSEKEPMKPQNYYMEDYFQSENVVEPESLRKGINTRLFNYE